MKLKGVFFLFAAVLLVASSIAAQTAAPAKTIMLPTGTTAEKAADGGLVFSLPDGTQVDLTGLAKGPADPGGGGDVWAMTQCLIRDGSGKLIASGKAGRLFGGPKPAGQPAAGGTVKVDNVVVYLPAFVEVVEPRVFNRTVFLKMTEAGKRTGA